MARSLASLWGKVEVDFPAIMLRMRRLRADISPTDSCERFQTELGIDVFQVLPVIEPHQQGETAFWHIQGWTKVQPRGSHAILSVPGKASHALV